jgi:2-polyprenyl-3-methyl-5-hydroxy-6-metoxy-1,4-benzoquinol methylase
MGIDLKRTGFHFKDVSDIAAQPSVEAEIGAAMKNYMVKALGRDPREVQALIQMDLERKIPTNALEYLDSLGIPVRGKRVLDLGAGLGAVSHEFQRIGAVVVAMEPGEVWRGVVKRRLTESGGESPVVAGVGEHLPFRDNAFDLIVSYQVLEHVQDPASVLRECFRVCRPGGYFHFSCENYLSFREAHYNVFWLPLMPKWIGRAYLKLRGRNPEFLDTGVTYTTVPSVARAMRDAGFVSIRRYQIEERLREPSLLRAGWKRASVKATTAVFPADRLASAALWLEQTTHLFNYLINELAHKPAAQGAEKVSS